MAVLLAALALTPAAYRTQAAGICTQSSATQRPVAAHLSTRPTRAQALAYWPRLLSLARAEVRRLGALAVPASLRADHEAAVAAQAAQLDLFAQALAAVRAGATPRQASAGMEPKLVRLVATERAAWRGAGVPTCAGVA